MRVSVPNVLNPFSRTRDERLLGRISPVWPQAAAARRTGMSNLVHDGRPSQSSLCDTRLSRENCYWECSDKPYMFDCRNEPYRQELSHQLRKGVVERWLNQMRSCRLSAERKRTRTTSTSLGWLFSPSRQFTYLRLSKPKYDAKCTWILSIFKTMTRCGAGWDAGLAL
jgi:hypothetical protein